MPAVIAMAAAPQKPTRSAPFQMFAPPARAASIPSRTNKISEATETKTIKSLAGTIKTISKGRAAPREKVKAEAIAA